MRHRSVFIMGIVAAVAALTGCGRSQPADPSEEAASPAPVAVETAR